MGFELRLSFGSPHLPYRSNDSMIDIQWRRPAAFAASALILCSVASSISVGAGKAYYPGRPVRSRSNDAPPSFQSDGVPLVAARPQAVAAQPVAKRTYNYKQQPSYTRRPPSTPTTSIAPTAPSSKMVVPPSAPSYITPGNTPAVITPIVPPTLDPSEPKPDTTPALRSSTRLRSTSEIDRLREKIRKVLTLYYPKRQNSRDNDCWEIMHAVIAYGLDSEIHREGANGRLVNGAGWLCFNGACQNYRMLYVENNRVMARQGVGVQGHYGQFLAILAQSQMPLSYPMKVEDREFTVGDLLESEKVTCQSNMELTFKLIAITHYADSLDDTWTNQWGQEWSVSKLVQEEIAAPIRGAACGGTHRLTGLAYAVRKRELLDEPMDGEFARAKKYLQDYHRYTFALQSRDGSFSTDWFRGPQSRPDVGRRLQTTGHILEWLVFSLPESELAHPRVMQAANYLASIMLSDPSRDWEIGPLGHAIHALSLYDQRLHEAMQGDNSVAYRQVWKRN